jgi:hypothetical protein
VADGIPAGLWRLIAGLVALTAVVLGLVAWAVFAGDAGQQRGLVLRNQVSEAVVVEFEDGQSLRIASGTAGTFVLRREDFPQTVSARTAGGDLVAEREFQYGEFADHEFRWDIDRAGFFPTEESRTVTP